MTGTSDLLETERLNLRRLRPDDLDAFSSLHADPEVMRDLGGPCSRAHCKAKLARYIRMYQDHGYSRYGVVDRAGDFLGYVGICPRDSTQSLGAHNEIGWRLHRHAWGKGYATEAARACITEFRRVFPLGEIISYTAPDNLKSQRVMTRSGLTRAPDRDFRWVNPDGTGEDMLVWEVPKLPDAGQPLRIADDPH